MKSNVKEIRIKRGEGPNHLVGIWHTFPTADQVDRWIISQEDTLPEVGYDKFDFTIEWESGDTYEGRLDALRPTNPRYTTGRNQPLVQAKEYIEYLVAHSEEHKEEAQKFLDNLNF